MSRLRLPLAAALAALALCAPARAQVALWGGGFPNNHFSVATNWVGGVAPLNDGTETLEFNDLSSGSMALDVNALFMAVNVTNDPENGGTNEDITGAHTLTLGPGGITVVANGEGNSNELAIDASVVLAANQVWSQSANAEGSLQVNGAISGGYSVELLGDGTCGAPVFETFSLSSPSSTFTGGVTVTGNGTTLVLGSGSSGGVPGAPAQGPAGTGTLSLGDGTSLEASYGGPLTLGNALSLGDGSNGNPITFGGQGPFTSGSTQLTLTGPLTLNDADIELDAAPGSIVTLAGGLAGATAGVCLDFGGMGNGSSVFIVQGNISNVARLDLEDSVSVILDSSPSNLAGTGTTQVSGIEDIGTAPTTYLGLGAGYAGAGNVSGFISWLNATGSAANFQGTLGFDTTTGAVQVFNSDPVNLSNFTSTGFVGIGSETTAILGPTAVITPPGTTYLFGGGGGTLIVESALSDAPGPGTGLSLNQGNAPLTLVLSGPLSYTGPTNVGGAALIFDTPLPSGALNLTLGYIGTTPSSGYTDANSNIQAFINLFNPSEYGIVGFDSLTGGRTITSPIDMTGLNLYLGTATPDGVTLTGTITPDDQTYRFAAVKGGSLTVSSVLSDLSVTQPDSVLIGLQNQPESFYADTTGGAGQSSVMLSGINTYSGGTFLSGGYLFVTSDSSLGTGPLVVPNSSDYGWVATLASAGPPVTLANAISLPPGGLALNTGSTGMLTLTGTLSDYTAGGSLGIFGPVTLSGTNTYTGSTFISGASVTATSDWAFGGSQLNVNNSTLLFTSANPELNNSVQLFDSTVTFEGRPAISNLYLSGSTINFDGPSEVVSGFSGDSPGSGNVIALTLGSVLTFDLGDNGGPTYHGLISGAGSIAVTGGNNLELRGSNTYSGGTLVTGGSFVIASNSSALGTGAVALNNGALITNIGVTVTNPISFVGAGGALGGFGTFSPGGNLAFQGGSYLGAGSAGFAHNQSSVPGPGTLTFAGGTSLTFGPGGGLIFALADASGTAGTGYGTVNVAGSGTLTITALPTNPFLIDIASFGPLANEPGPASNFVATNAYSWTLLSAASISGFSAGDFTFNTSNLQNSIGSGSFFVSQSGDDLVLNFTPVPEPSTWALMASGLCALGAAVRRRRR
jgi:autotransporter-associated beta strand protein